MLTINIYRNVPIEKNYSDVLYFSNDNEKLTYLSTYLVGTISNVNKFFSVNDTYIDLSTAYENCNYMCIMDDRSIKQYKFYFIDNFNFVSGGAVRYNITLDVWTTYGNNFTFGYATFTGGHADVITNKDSEFTTDYNIITGVKNWQTNERIGKKLLYRYPSKYTMIAILNELGTIAQGVFENPRIAYVSGDYYEVLKFYCGLAKNKYQLRGSGGSTADYEYELLKCYLIPDFDLDEYYDDFHNSYEEATFYSLRWNDLSDAVTARLVLNRYEWYDEDTQTWYTTRFNLVHEIDIKSDVPFFNMNSYDNFKYKFKIGTINNNIEIKPFMYNNSQMRLYMTLLNYNQISFNLEYEGNILDLTNDFELPVINDSYTLYMAQNQARFASANKQAILNAGFGIVTAGMGLSKPQNAVGGVVGAYNQIQAQNALNADMQKSPDRVDTSFTSGYLPVLYGVGCFAFEINDKYLPKYINDFGVVGNYKSNVWKPSNMSLYNFYYVRYDNLDIKGNFDYDIRQKLIDIFKNGVRVWCDKSNYLSNVNYKK